MVAYFQALDLFALVRFAQIQDKGHFETRMSARHSGERDDG